MYLNLESTQRLAQVFYYIFVLVTSINKISFTLVSSEDVSHIPLRLYQTKQSESPQIQHNTFEEKLENVFKRATQGGFYGIRGKLVPDGSDVESIEEKRSAFYPMRGKKKAAAFTALRGKKEFDANSYNDKTYDGESDEMLQEKNSTPIQSPVNSERLRDYMNLKAKKIITDDKVTSANDPYISLLPTDNESVKIQPWRNILNQEKSSLSSSNDVKSNIIDDDDSKLYDDILAKEYGENGSNDDQMINKRRNSGFIPMRGRKFYSDMVSQTPTDKRKSSFIPMRGRKSDIFGEWHPVNKEFLFGTDKKSVGFLPMRGRRSIFSQSRFNRLQQKTRWPFSEGKRVAFHAVRGKKNLVVSDWNYPNQAFYSPQIGKLDDYDNEDSEDTSGYAGSFIKNFPSSTDHGSLLRIKRSLQGRITRGKSRSTVGIKRPSAFFASRGKRFGSDVLPQSSLYSL